ncbi:MAG: c-type cytochrome [Myxococcales bacterium]|nr:c-type cytochrome [Myxococcales bacterium]
MRWTIPMIGLAASLLAACGGSAACDEILQLQGDLTVGDIVYGNRCETCHGPAGEGDEGPALTDRIPRITRCRVISQVVDGGGLMPAFGDSLDPQDIADVVEFVSLEFR